MKFTLVIGFCPQSHYLPLAEAADRAGFDSICVPDGLFYYERTSVPYPYSDDGGRHWNAETPFIDPLVIIPMMAAVTKRIRFFTNVLKLPVRHPLLVAKAASSIAVMSDNRLGLGIGLSPWPEDFEVLDQQWDNRGPRSAEMIEVIRGICAGGMWEHHGRFYDFPPMQIAPVPDKPIPIYIGGLVEAVYRRAARIGDGYIGWVSPKCSMDDLANIVRRLHRYRDEYETAEKPFEIKAMPESSDVGVIGRLQEIGITDAIVMPWMFYDGDFFDLDHRLESVQRFADEVIAGYR